MLNDNMNRGRLMVQEKQVEDRHQRMRDRESKKCRSSDQFGLSNGIINLEFRRGPS